MTNNQQLSVPSLDLEAPLPLVDDKALSNTQLDPFVKRMQLYWWVGIGLTSLFGIVLVAVGYSYLQLSKPVPLVENNKVVESLPSPAPSPQLPTLVITIWNGSGKAGAAKKLSDTFAAAGVTVTGVSNAPKVRTGTLVEYSPLFSPSLTLLEAKLTELGVGPATYEQTLTGSEEYGVRIVIGK